MQRNSRLSFVTASSPDQASQSLLSISPKASSPTFGDRLGGQKGSHLGRSSLTNERPVKSSRTDKWRLWRHDAYMQHQYETAAFAGETVLALTGDPNDAFWLAQVYFSTGHYPRAKFLLEKNELVKSSTACCYLAAKCLINLSEWTQALDLLGETNPFRSDGAQMGQSELGDGGIKLEASLCYLRGLVYSNTNIFDRAKECYKEALSIDVRCYEAFDQLISNSLLSAQEEKDLLQQLDFRSLGSPEDIEFCRLTYFLRLNKFYSPKEIKDTEAKLIEQYGMTESLELAKCQAELLFTQGKFRECLQLTKRVLQSDPCKFNIMHIHLSCLHELEMVNELFLISHDLAEKYSQEPVSWLAVGIYYLSVGKTTEARRYFSKASVMDPKFGPAWIGFAHTFAMESEHDQAVSAYTTAARLFQGSHLPNLFLGMQHLQLANMALAEEYFAASYELCSTDPLLLNELGVIAFQQLNLPKAITHFRRALELAYQNDTDPKNWASTWTNLGHAYRKSKYVTVFSNLIKLMAARKYEDALQAFSESLALAPQDANIHSATALIYMIQENRTSAIEHLHKALSVSPSDTISTDLLNTALEQSAASGLMLQNVETAHDDSDDGSSDFVLAHDTEHLEKESSGDNMDLSDDDRPSDYESTEDAMDLFTQGPS